ncbi:MAG: hypothetical protein M3341_11590, partial [Actinomycetota bacterium]|nr:hypothetical protein [Actinomycetota bacterium]
MHWCLEGYLGAFDAMQGAAVNRRLQLHRPDVAEPREAREKRPRILTTAHRWQGRRVRHFAVLPCGMDVM